MATIKQFKEQMGKIQMQIDQLMLRVNQIEQKEIAIRNQKTKSSNPQMTASLDSQLAILSKQKLLITGEGIQTEEVGVAVTTASVGNIATNGGAASYPTRIGDGVVAKRKKIDDFVQELSK